VGVDVGGDRPGGVLVAQDLVGVQAAPEDLRAGLTVVLKRAMAWQEVATKAIGYRA
jgi:hypothetical protein